MEIKEVQASCPCCGERLVVDVRTGRVLRHQRAAEHDETGKRVVREEDWTAANARVSERLNEAEDDFSAGLAREKSREKDLDDLFRKAKEKLDPPDEG